MKSSKSFLFFSVFFVGLALADVPASHASDMNENIESTLKPSSFRAISRLLVQYDPRFPISCNNFPRICRARGSPGPDCCKRQCVNVMTDGLNCGQCGKKCKYGEVCCGGNCVNVMLDRKHCGDCHKRCEKGSYCRYGMCSYA